MACPSCGAGLHFECETDPCCCGGVSPEIDEEIYDRGHTRGRSRDSALKDQQSTGRKRAALDYPLDRELPCEWQGLLLAGGGQFPIIGCMDGLQQARHHGPDKNTLNNDKGNVHRICARCHNRWHTKNDPGYTPGNPGKSHDPDTKATIMDIAKNEGYWARNKPKKIKGD